MWKIIIEKNSVKRQIVFGSFFKLSVKIKQKKAFFILDLYPNLFNFEKCLTKVFWKNTHRPLSNKFYKVVKIRNIILQNNYLAILVQITRQNLLLFELM